MGDDPDVAERRRFRDRGSGVRAGRGVLPVPAAGLPVPPGLGALAAGGLGAGRGGDLRAGVLAAALRAAPDARDAHPPLRAGRADPAHDRRRDVAERVRPRHRAGRDRDRSDVHRHQRAAAGALRAGGAGGVRGAGRDRERAAQRRLARAGLRGRAVGDRRHRRGDRLPRVRAVAAGGPERAGEGRALHRPQHRRHPARLGPRRHRGDHLPGRTGGDRGGAGRQPDHARQRAPAGRAAHAGHAQPDPVHPPALPVRRRGRRPLRDRRTDAAGDAGGARARSAQGDADRRLGLDAAAAAVHARLRRGGRAGERDHGRGACPCC